MKSSSLADKPGRLPVWAIFALGLFAVLVVEGLDRILPVELSFSSCYFLAVAWVGWWAGRWPALWLALITSAALTFLEGPHPGLKFREAVIGWNFITRFIGFAAVGWLMAEVKHLTHHFAELVAQRSVALEEEVQRHKATSARLAEALDLARLAQWEYDATSGLFTFDDRFYALYGTTAEREGRRQMSAGDYAREFLFPEDSSLVAKNIARAMASNDPDFSVRVEHRIRRRDGETRDLLVRVVRLKDASGRAIGLRGVNQDLTELKRAEEAMKLQSLVLQNMAEAVFLVAPDMTIRLSNPAADAMFGWKPGELLGKPVSLLNAWPPEETHRVNLDVARSVRENGFWTGEYLNRRKDGATFTSESRISALELGGRLHFVSVQQDVTQRRQAEAALRDARQQLEERVAARTRDLQAANAALRESEQKLRELNENLEQRVNERTAALRESEERFRTLIANAPIGITAYKADGECILANEAAAQITGGPLADVARQNFRRLDSWRRSPLLETADAALRSGQPQHCECFVTSSFGRRLWLGAKFAAFASQGEPHLLMLTSDIRNRNRRSCCSKPSVTSPSTSASPTNSISPSTACSMPPCNWKPSIAAVSSLPRRGPAICA